MKSVIGGAAKSLVVIQNTYLEKKSTLRSVEINKVKLEIELAQNKATLANLKQTLVSEERANQLLFDLATEKVLQEQKKSLLEQAVASAKSELAEVQLVVHSEKTTLQRVKSLVPILESRREELVLQLDALNVSRTKLFELINKTGSNGLFSEALLAIDGRDNRFRSSISEIDKQLLSDIPAQEATARQALLNGQVNITTLHQSLAVAEQAVAVFDVEQAYEQRGLEEKGNAIDVQLAGLDAEQAAKIQLLEQQLAGLELTFEQSTESTVIAPVAAKKQAGKSMFVYVVVGACVGVFLGCFLALFLELLAKAKERACELA